MFTLFQLVDTVRRTGIDNALTALYQIFTDSRQIDPDEP
jgi:hypothetical protein